MYTIANCEKLPEGSTTNTVPWSEHRDINGMAMEALTRSLNGWWSPHDGYPMVFDASKPDCQTPDSISQSSQSLGGFPASLNAGTILETIGALVSRLLFRVFLGQVQHLLSSNWATRPGDLESAETHWYWKNVCICCTYIYTIILYYIILYYIILYYIIFYIILYYIILYYILILYNLYFILYIIYYILYMIYDILCIIYNILYMIYYVLYIIYDILYMIYYGLYIIHYILYIIYDILCIIYYILYIIYYILYIYILYIMYYIILYYIFILYNLYFILYIIYYILYMIYYVLYIIYDILYIMYYIILYYIILYYIQFLVEWGYPKSPFFCFNAHGMPIPTRLILLVMARPFTRWTLTVDV